jgi:hypothetical protein
MLTPERATPSILHPNWNGMASTLMISLHELVVNNDLSFSLLTVLAFPSISDVAFHTLTCTHTLIKSGRSYHMFSYLRIPTGILRIWIMQRVMTLHGMNSRMILLC